MIFLLMALFVVVKTRGDKYDNTAWLLASIGIVEAAAEFVSLYGLILWVVLNA